jgi:hypothetical protein
VPEQSESHGDGILRARAKLLVRRILLASGWLLISCVPAQSFPVLDARCVNVQEVLNAPLESVSRQLGSVETAVKTASHVTQDGLASLIDELLNWIAGNTNYDVSEARRHKPNVSFCNFGDHLDYEHKNLIVESQFRGLYDKERRHIYLVAPWSPDDLQNVGTLLHELLHDVQLLNKDWPCWGRAEWQAYKLQEKWLKERGVDPGFSWIQIFLETRCTKNVHP